MFKKFFSLITLTISILTSFLNLHFFSLFSSVLFLIIGFTFFKKNTRLFLTISIISLATIITNILILYKTNQGSTDIFESENILLGEWLYNNGSYIFNEDNTYFQYHGQDNTDNYCKGIYKYQYGGIGDNGEIIKEDKNFYYYNLELNEKYCLILGNEYYVEEKHNMVFGIDKKNYSYLLFMDKDNNSLYKITKKKNTSS